MSQEVGQAVELERESRDTWQIPRTRLRDPTRPSARPGGSRVIEQAGQESAIFPSRERGRASER